MTTPTAPTPAIRDEDLLVLIKEFDPASVCDCGHDPGIHAISSLGSKRCYQAVRQTSPMAPDEWVDCPCRRFRPHRVYVALTALRARLLALQRVEQLTAVLRDEMAILVESLVAASESAAQNPEPSTATDVGELLQRYASHADRLLKKTSRLTEALHPPAEDLSHD